MNLGTKNANDLTSKDRSLQKAAAERIINEIDTETFSVLCEKSDFLFDFIKAKIIENLVGAVTSKNVQNIFEFTKIYNADFEPFITGAFLKFANEDLTDEILNLYEEGSKEQMAYASAYFCNVLDPLCLEYLNKTAFDEFEPLAQNSAKALFKFNDRTLYNKAIEAISDVHEDEFEKYKYVNFITNYGDKNGADILLNYLKTSLAKTFCASSILYLKSFFELKIKDSAEIFDIIIEAYPEELSLETVFDFEVYDFINHLYNKTQSGEIQESYVKRLLLKAKGKFNLILEDDIYTFDVSNEAKKEIKRISEYLNKININLFVRLEEELFCGAKTRILEALNVILNFGKVEFSKHIVKLLDETGDDEIILSGINVLKVFNKLQELDREKILEKIQNENVKAVASATFS